MAARYFDDYEEGEQDCSGDDQHGESFATVDTSAIQQQQTTTEYDIETGRVQFSGRRSQGNKIIVNNNTIAYYITRCLFP